MLHTKTLSMYELAVQAWWDDTLIYSNHFFDMTATLRFDALETDVVILYHELEMIRTSFEEADYPYAVTDARRHLLNSMNKVMNGFHEFISGNIEAARQHMTKAQRDLRNLEDELARLGIPTSYNENQLLH
jgi:hypothetical protein